MPVYKLREGLLAIKEWENYWVYEAWAWIQSETKRNASYVKYSGMQNVKAWISYMGSQKVRKDIRVKHSFISTSRCEAENFWARCHYRGHIWRVAQGASLRHPARCLLEGNPEKKLLMWFYRNASYSGPPWPIMAFQIDLRAGPLSSLCAWETLRPSPGRRTRVRVEGLVKPWGRSTEVRFNLFRRRRKNTEMGV